MKYLLSLALLFSTVPAHAIRFNCTATETLAQLQDGGNRQKAASVGLGIDFIFAHCKDKKDRDFVVGIMGLGLPLRLNNEYFTVACPFVRKSRFEGQVAYFGGIRAGATIGVGAQLGLFSNKYAGVCVIGGVNTGVGATAVFADMRIAEGTNIEDVRADGLKNSDPQE